MNSNSLHCRRRCAPVSSAPSYSSSPRAALRSARRAQWPQPCHHATQSSPPVVGSMELSKRCSSASESSVPSSLAFHDCVDEAPRAAAFSPWQPSEADARLIRPRVAASGDSPPGSSRQLYRRKARRTRAAAEAQSRDFAASSDTLLVACCNASLYMDVSASHPL